MGKKQRRVPIVFVALLSDQSVLKKFWLHKRKRLIAGVYVALKDFPKRTWNVLSTKSNVIDKRELPEGDKVMTWRILSSKKHEHESNERKPKPLLKALPKNVAVPKKPVKKKVGRKGHKKPL